MFGLQGPAWPHPGTEDAPATSGPGPPEAAEGARVMLGAWSPGTTGKTLRLNTTRPETFVLASGHSPVPPFRLVMKPSESLVPEPRGASSPSCGKPHDTPMEARALNSFCLNLHDRTPGVPRGNISPNAQERFGPTWQRQSPEMTLRGTQRWGQQQGRGRYSGECQRPRLHVTFLPSRLWDTECSSHRCPPARPPAPHRGASG